MYTTYILYSEKLNSFYTGHTSDIVRRLEEHNRGKTSFMARGMPWELVFFRDSPTRSEAVKLETIIKKRGAGRFLSDNYLQGG